MYLKELEANTQQTEKAAQVVVAEPEQDATDDQIPVTATPTPAIAQADTSKVDTPDVPMRFEEKKRLDWAGKTCQLLYASPSPEILTAPCQTSHR